MNETLEDLKNKRTAVYNDFNTLYDEIKLEIHINTIKQLKAKIEVLERDLAIYKQLLEDETRRGQQYKEQLEFMKKVKTIEIK